MPPHAEHAAQNRVRARYDQEVAQRGLVRDAAQLRAVAALDRLAGELAARAREPRRPLLSRLRFFGRNSTRSTARGVYLWGGVGRGKTFLMDLFFETLTTERKQRQHFHRFMHALHGRLKKLGDVADPLLLVADDIAARVDLICFDEFLVIDIADAMLLGTLFTALFERGVALVATSNVAPANLYRDGLQRARFLPAIAQLERHTEVVNVDGETDYRLRILSQAEIYHAPLDAAAESNLEKYFAQIAPGAGSADCEMKIEGRQFRLRRRADGVGWFEFSELCAGPRGAIDYIEIARCFQTVLVANVPQLDKYADDQARRFITLVDEFYDRNVKLILSAAVNLDELYVGERLSFEFRRTRSRLREMQSLEYLALPHLA